MKETKQPEEVIPLDLSYNYNLSSLLSNITSDKLQKAAHKALGNKTYHSSVDNLKFRIYGYICNHAAKYGGPSLASYLQTAKKFLNTDDYGNYLYFSVKQVLGYHLSDYEKLFLIERADFINTCLQNLSFKHKENIPSINHKQTGLGTASILGLLQKKQITPHVTSVEPILKEHKESNLIPRDKKQLYPTPEITRIQSKAFKRILREANDQYFIRFQLAGKALTNPQLFKKYAELSNKQLELIKNEKELPKEEYEQLLDLENMIDTYQDHLERIKYLESLINKKDQSTIRRLQVYIQCFNAHMQIFNSNPASKYIDKNWEKSINQIDEDMALQPTHLSRSQTV